MRKGLLKKIGMILLMTIIVIGGVAVGSKKVKASEVEPRLLEETEHGNCGEPEAYRSWIGGVIYEEVYYSFKNGVLTIYGRSDTPKEHVFDVRFNKILNGYFENCTNIEKVVVNVDEIVFGENAFKGCTNLTTVTMPKVINILSTSAFEGCEKLESIIFPDGCRLQNSGISKNCFKNCTSLTSIELPSHCNQINTGVFEGCTNLETVVFEEIVDYRGLFTGLYSTPFNECSNLTTIVMKNKNSDLNDDNSITSIKTMIDYAASASSNLSTIKVPHQYADDAREYIETQLESDIGRSLEKPIDVVAIYSVAFDNNGYDTAPDSILADGNKSITAPTPLADDTKCFAGWYKEATCENAWDFENDLVTEDITLYAKWNDNHVYANVTDSGLHKCVICGKEESHDFSKYVSNGDSTHKVVCKDCDTLLTGHASDACSVGTATCKAKAKCSKCGEEYGPYFYVDSTTRIVIEAGVKNIPTSLVEKGLDTEEKISEKMFRTVAQKTEGYTSGKTIILDVVFQVSLDGGNTWVKATPDNFPSEGLVVTIPYPEGTNADDYDFVVTHMVTVSLNGLNPGDVEMPAVTKTAKGIQFTVKSLSPIGVSWKALSNEDVETGEVDNRVWLIALLVSLGTFTSLVLSKRKRKEA